MRSRQRLRRFAKLAAAFALALVFVVVLGVAALFHTDIEPVRRVAVERINAALMASFRGQIELTNVTRLRAGVIEDARLVVRDPRGREVLRLEGVDGSYDAWALIRSFLRRSEPIDVTIRELEIADGHVVIEQGQSGELTLVEAFAARDPTAEKGRDARIDIERLSIRHVWVHGGVDALPVIDVELSDLIASLASAPQRFSFGVERTKFLLRRIHRDVSVRGRLEGDLSLRPEAPETLAVHASVSAQAGEVAAELQGSFVHERLEAELDMPKTEAAHVRAIFPELPLYAPVALHVRAEGTLAELAAEAQAVIGAARIDVEAEGGLRHGTPELEVKLVAQRLDARAFSPDAPKTSLDLRGAVRARLLDEGRRPHAEFSLESKPGAIAGTAIPAVSVEGRFTERRLVAHARVQEPGAPAIVDLAFTEASGTRPGQVEIEARMEAIELARVTRLPERIRGRGELRLSAQVTLPRAPDTPMIHASFSGRGTRLVHASASARTLSFSGAVDGPSASPELTLRAEARDIVAAGRRVERAALTANGPVAAPHVDLALRGPDVPATRARAIVSFADGVTARALSAKLERDGVTAEARARRIAFRDGVIVLDALRVTGIGELDASARIGPRTARLRATAAALRLDEFARVAGIGTVHGGTASFDIALRSDRNGLYGNVTASLRELAIGKFSGGSADADLDFEGRSVRGSLQAALDKAVTISATSTALRLPRAPVSLESLTKLEGDVRVRSDADLAALARFLPRQHMPFGNLRGKVRLDAIVSRDDARHELDAVIEVASRGLMITGPVVGPQNLTRQEAMRRAIWEIAGVDATLRAELTNRGAPSRVNLRVIDRKGKLAELEAEAELGLTELVKAPRMALKRALDAPLRAKLSIPSRSIDDLPRMVRPHGLTGDVALTAELSGKLGNPQVELDAAGKRLRPRARRDALPFDVQARGQFANSRGRAEVFVERRGVDVLRVDSRFELAVADLVRGRDPRLNASAAVRANGFELESIPWLKDQKLAGRVNGRLDLDGLGRDAKLDGGFTITEMRIGETPVREMRWSIHTTEARLHSELSLRQTDGDAFAKVDAGLLWGSRIVPQLDSSRPLVARVKAKNLRAGVFLPLVDRNIAKLDGRLDANLRAELGDGVQRLQGGANVREGVVQLPAMGQELRRIRARIELRPDGVVLIRDVSARGLVGRVRATAALRLQGLRLAAARASVRIAKEEKMPLTVEGVSLGEAWGALDIEAVSPSPKLTRVEVDVRSFHVELPTGTRQEVQSLEPAARIRVGVRQPTGRFVTLPLQPLKEKEPNDTEPSELRVVVKLGNDVWIRQGTQLRVKLDGAVAIRMLDEPLVRGQLQLTRGRIDVQGKIFELVNGTITFQDDPENPTIVATARWESPDKIAVYADFTGPVQSGTLALRSEPALSQDEILALLLFGTPDGSLGSGQAGDGGKSATAVALGGGVATKGLNAGLRGLTDMDVSTRIDTSGQSPRPELAVQVSRRVTAELAYALGDSAPGKPPDRTFFTLDFRLGRRWSLATTFGDRGSSLLDLLWRHRY